MPAQSEKIGFKIDEKKCNNCKRCEQVCVLTRFSGYKTITEALKRHCMSCGHCLVVCPNDAIVHPDIKKSGAIGELPTVQQMMNLIKRARSTRAFKSEEIKQEHMDVIIETFKYSQTGMNLQKIDMVVINSKEVLNKVSTAIMKMYDLLKFVYNFPITAPFMKLTNQQNIWQLNLITATHAQRRALFEHGKDPILYNAPALLLLIGPKGLSTGKDDADIAAENITMIAPTLGLGTCYMASLTIANSFNFKPLMTLLKLPKGYCIYQTLIMGYPKYTYQYAPERKPRKVTYI